MLILLDQRIDFGLGDHNFVDIKETLVDAGHFFSKNLLFSLFPQLWVFRKVVLVDDFLLGFFRTCHFSIHLDAFIDTPLFYSFQVVKLKRRLDSVSCQQLFQPSFVLLRQIVAIPIYLS